MRGVILYVHCELETVAPKPIQDFVSFDQPYGQLRKG